MNLDDLSVFHQLDTQNMIGSINRLPDQLTQAWDMGMSLPMPSDLQGLRQIVFVGVGGSSIGADLLEAYAARACPVPLLVHRDYDLPAWVGGHETLVIASSHSGNSEETLAAFAQARSRGCRRMTLSTGGRLAEIGQCEGSFSWQFAHSGQPQMAVGYTFGMLLAALYRLGLLPDPQTEVREAVEAMRSQQKSLLPEIPAAHNPAKRMAGQLVGRWVTVFAADDLLPVARRWKGQISAAAKAWAQFEAIPEANHNSLAGISHPENTISQMIALFLIAPSNHPRNQVRLELTRKVYMLQGINTDFFRAKGQTRMAHLWTLLQMGDTIAYYLAMAYGEDPTPVDAISMMKQELDALEE